MAKLLIVDDDQTLGESVGNYFQRQGHEFILAAGVNEALDTTRALSPDLVVSDFFMNDGTGMELRQGIRGLHLRQDPYFILITGHPSEDMAREALVDGVDLLLTKPFHMPALDMAVHQALVKKAQQRGDSALKPAEAFYHDFFLALNPVLPRLLMLIEGRYGGLAAEQVHSLGAVFDSWRTLAWTMADFYPRMQDPESARMDRRRWSGPATLKKVLARLQGDLNLAQVRVETLREPHLPVAWVHGATAEAILEAALLRLVAFTAPGAALRLAWSATDECLQLSLSSDLMHHDLSEELMRAVALLPPMMPRLEEAGVRLHVSDSIGPWTLSFLRHRP